MLVFLPSAAANASTLTPRAAGALAALAAISGVAGKLGSKRRRDDGWAVPMLAAAAAGSAVILVLSVSFTAFRAS
jgi:hypothetical protein